MVKKSRFQTNDDSDDDAVVEQEAHQAPQDTPNDTTAPQQPDTTDTTGPKVINLKSYVSIKVGVRFCDLATLVRNSLLL